MADFDRESMMDMFTFEMNQLLEQLEQNIIQGENGYTMDQINEIFRIMHTIKGSAAMMMFNNIASSAHAIEDLFYYLRDESPKNVDFSRCADLVLESMDFIKEELIKIEQGEKSEGDSHETSEKIKSFLADLKSGGSKAPATKPVAQQKNQQKKDTKETNKDTKDIKEKDTNKNDSKDNDTINHYRARIRFEDGCEMENVRSFTLLNNLKPIAQDITHEPEDIIDEGSITPIRDKGFSIKFSSKRDYEEVHDHLYQTVYLSQLALEQMNDEGKYILPGGKTYLITINFGSGIEPENTRANALVHNLKNKIEKMEYSPEDLSSDESVKAIQEYGFHMELTTAKSYDELTDIFGELVSLRDIIIEEKYSSEKEHDENASSNNSDDKSNDSQNSDSETSEAEVQNGSAEPASNNETNNTESSTPATTEAPATGPQQTPRKPAVQNVISVNVNKLDKLLKLMGEIVIAEAMVTQHPELEGLKLDNFYKETRQLRTILKDLQATIMSMRMLPLSTTFFKMNRIVRDMCKQLNKEIQLEIVGEDTEVDKNIIEHISDPIMHIIRNSADHGIEMPEERLKKGKSEKGTILLEAKNSGSDVLIIIKDDGKGLDKEAILKKARNNGLLTKPETEYTDKEIHQFIFMPGFSTNNVVTNFSGRGVGMDVVSSNIELVNGTVLVESVPGEGSVFTLKIPLTLAIIDGMVVTMGGAKYILPIMSIKDTFRPKLKDVFYDPNGNEMITHHGECYNIVRLYDVFGLSSEVTNLEDGILVMLENGDDFVCLFIDDLINEQQIVVKPIPKYIKKARGISGCTLLGNGEISLIVDVAGFFDR